MDLLENVLGHFIYDLKLSVSLPVLRKRGKLISFLRTFFTSRPTRATLKRTGIMKERVFGCDLGEHLLNSGHDGKTSIDILRGFVKKIKKNG